MTTATLEETLSTPTVARLTGATFRQLDYWTRMGVLHIAGQGRGSGTCRRWTLDQAALARVAYHLASLGAPCAVIGPVVAAIETDPAWWDEAVIVDRRGRIGRLSRRYAGGWYVDLADAFATVREAWEELRAA